MESIRGFIFFVAHMELPCRQVKPDFLERFATPLVKVTGGGKGNGRSAVMCYPQAFNVV